MPKCVTTVLLLLLLVLAVSGAACAADSSVDTVFDPCSPLTVHVDPDASDAELDSVRQAVEDWGLVLPTRIEIERAVAEPGDLRLRFESGHTFYRAIYWDELAEIDVSRDALVASDYALAVAHELGHAFGLVHVPRSERPSVMNVGNLEVAPSRADASAVRALWTTCN